MKRIAGWQAFLLALAAWWLCAPAARSAGPSQRISFEEDHVQMVRGDAYTECAIPGLSSGGAEGAPALPYRVLPRSLLTIPRRRVA